MFLMENWYLVVALMAVAGMVGVFIGRFLKMPTSEQRGERGMAAVGGQAGRGGAGERHGASWARQTYDLFIAVSRIAMAVSFDTFSLWSG